MTKEIDDVEYDPTQNIPVQTGVYPAHVSGFKERSVDTKMGRAYVYDLTHKIADNAKSLSIPLFENTKGKYTLNENGNRIPLLDEEGNEIKASCEFMIGRTYRGNGVFLFMDKSGAGRNERYTELLQVFKVQLKKIKTKVSGMTAVKLVRLEKDDVIGCPVLVRLGWSEFITKETRNLPESEQVKVRNLKVFDVFEWNSGKKLSSDEIEDDIPF